MTTTQRFSILPAHAVSDKEISDSEYRTLSAIATYADKNGWCWPSQAKLAEIRGISRKTVNEHVSKLKGRGYLNVTHRAREDGGQTSNMMQVKMDYPYAPEAEQPEAESAENVTPPVTSRGYTPCNPNEVTPPVTSRGYTPCNPNEVTPPVTSKGYTNTTINNTITNKREKSAPAAPSAPAPHQSAYVAQFETHEPIIADMIKALRDVTLHNNTAVLAERARELVAIQATPEEIRELFSGQGSYWYTAGAGAWGRGGRPNVGNVISDIYKAREWQQNGGGDSRKAAREADLLHAEWIAPLAGMNGEAGEWFRKSPSRLKAVLRTNGVGTVDQAARVTIDNLRIWFSESAKGQVTQ